MGSSASQELLRYRVDQDSQRRAEDAEEDEEALAHLSYRVANFSTGLLLLLLLGFLELAR